MINHKYLILQIIVSCFIFNFTVFGERIVCYFKKWPENAKSYHKTGNHILDPSICTHINFIMPRITVEFLSGSTCSDSTKIGSLYLKEYVSHLKRKNPKLKILLSFGTYHDSAQFDALLSNRSRRIDFALNSAIYLRRHNLDGLDILWERSQANLTLKFNFSSLVQELGNIFVASDLLLTLAFPGNIKDIESSFEIENIIKHVNFINLKAFDFNRGEIKQTELIAPLNRRKDQLNDQSLLNVNSVVRYLTHKGVPTSKIVLGISLFAKSYELENASQDTPGSPILSFGSFGEISRKSGIYSLAEVCQIATKKWKRVWDKEQKGTYIINSNHWVTYEDGESILAKANYVKRNNLGGLMAWKLDMDDTDGYYCLRGSFPFIKAMRSHLNESNTIKFTQQKNTSSLILNNNKKVKNGESDLNASSFELLNLFPIKKRSIEALLPSNRILYSIEGEFLREITKYYSLYKSKVVKKRCFRGDGYFADLSSYCQKYYSCEMTNTINEKVKFFSCPSGTLFDETTRKCSKDLKICTSQNILKS